MKKVFNMFLRLLPIIKNKILFECGRGMVDENPKAIYDYIKENHPNDYKLVWIVSKDTDVSNLDKNDYCYNHTIKSIIARATSKYWIKSESIGSSVVKRKKQIYIQTWHGQGALKKMGYDTIGTEAPAPLEHVKEWDYLITNDELNEKIMLSSTGYNKKTVMLGTLKNDYIYRNKEINRSLKKEILKKLGIDSDKPIILYAPTFRDKELSEDVIDLRIDCLKNLNDYIVLLRVHPLVRNKIDESIFHNSNIVNASLYPNCKDLLCISDILISDYSSIIYAYSILERPIIFYAYDLDEYKKERGFYINYPEDLPGEVVYNEKQLYNAVVSVDKNKEKYRKKLQDFNARFNSLNKGVACEKFYSMLKNGEFK